MAVTMTATMCSPIQILAFTLGHLLYFGLSLLYNKRGLNDEEKRKENESEGYEEKCRFGLGRHAVM